MTRSRTLKGSVLALAAAFAISACSVHPGSAAIIGSERISDSTLDDVALALCSAQGGAQTQQPQQLASRAARQGALKVMIDSALSTQYGDSLGVRPDQKQVSAALSANAQSIAGLPAARRGAFTATLRSYAEGQLALIEIGRRELVKNGAQNITQQQAVSAGTKLRNAWAKRHVDVSVDPRYGEYANNTLLTTSGSLSVAASSRSEDGASPDPSAAWVAALPASQKCS